MIKGTICCNCNKKEATKCWVGGQPLCDDCYELWKNNHERIIKEANQERGLGKFKKEKNVNSWFGG